MEPRARRAGRGGATARGPPRLVFSGVSPHFDSFRLGLEPKKGLASLLAAVYGHEMLPASLYKLLADLLRYVPAYLMSELLSLLESHEAPAPRRFLRLRSLKHRGTWLEDGRGGSL